MTNDKEPASGVSQIRDEREKQVLKWGLRHDMEHTDGALVIAAGQLLDAVLNPDASLPDMWGLVSKHQDPIARLRIAGALIAAEIDRIQMAKFLSDAHWSDSR